MNTTTLTIRNDGPVAEIRLERPARRNALSQLMLLELTEAFEWLGRRSRAGVLLTASGPVFSAGADIHELSQVRHASRASEAGRDIARAAKTMIATIEATPFPVIACVDGPALGGGLELVLGCDLIYATRNARFGFPEPTLGLIPGFGGTRRIIERIGVGPAKDLLLGGAAIDAETAKSMGLVNRVTEPPTLVAEATRTLTAGPPRSPQALSLLRATIRAAVDLPRDEAFAHETTTYGRAFDISDSAAGLSAFRDKRTPTFESDFRSDRWQ